MATACRPSCRAILEFSLESLTREQDKFRQQMMEAWGADPFKAIEEHSKRNMAMFSDAMRMFNPFAAMASQSRRGTRLGPQTGSKDDLQALKEQLSAMQRRLDRLAGDK